MDDTGLSAAVIFAGCATVIGTLATVVGGLATYIGTNWKKQEKKNSEEIAELKEDRNDLKKRAENCESDREEMKVRLARLEAGSKLSRNNPGMGSAEA